MSSDLAMSVRGLTKEYRISHQDSRHNRVTDAALSAIRGLVNGRSYETFRALDDVSFDVKKGEVVGVIGRNGAGKSTLLKILSRITEPTHGRIDLFGRVGSLLEVGTGFHPELTGRENIFLNGAILGMRKREIERQFDEIVAFAEVEKFLDTPVKRYSSGMYVRLAFAVAAHLNPEILIVDEVLAVGDAQFQQKCLGKMQEVSKEEGRTILFVSHNMAAVRSLCAQCLLMTHGRAVFMGDVDEALSLYSTRQDSQDTLLSGFKCLTDSVMLDEARINGRDSSEIYCTPDDHFVRIDLSGHIMKTVNMGVEITLTDASGMPLAFFGDGHMEGHSRRFDKGPFDWMIELELPSGANEGTYYLTIELTDHNVQHWIKGNQVAKLIFEGVPNAGGKPLNYNNAKGFLCLNGSITRREPVHG